MSSPSLDPGGTLFPQANADVALLRSLTAFALLTQDAKGLFSDSPDQGINPVTGKLIPATQAEFLAAFQNPRAKGLQVLRPSSTGDRDAEDVRRAFLIEQVAGPLPPGPLSDAVLADAGRKLREHQFLMQELDATSNKNALSIARLRLDFQKQVVGPEGPAAVVVVRASGALINAAEVFSRLGVTNLRRFSSQDTETLLELHLSLRAQDANTRLPKEQLDKINNVLADQRVFITPNVDTTSRVEMSEFRRVKSGLAGTRTLKTGATDPSAAVQPRDSEIAVERLINGVEERLAPAKVRVADAAFRRASPADAERSNRVVIGTRGR